MVEATCPDCDCKLQEGHSKPDKILEELANAVVDEELDAFYESLNPHTDPQPKTDRPPDGEVREIEIEYKKPGDSRPRRGKLIMGQRTIKFVPMDYEDDKFATHVRDAGDSSFEELIDPNSAIQDLSGHFKDRGPMSDMWNMLPPEKKKELEDQWLTYHKVVYPHTDLDDRPVESIQEKEVIAKVCAWCGDGKDKVRPGQKITHGICPDCLDKNTKNLGSDDLNVEIRDSLIADLNGLLSD